MGKVLCVCACHSTNHTKRKEKKRFTGLGLSVLPWPGVLKKRKTGHYMSFFKKSEQRFLKNPKNHAGTQGN